MKKYKVRFSVFSNFGSHEIVESNTENPDIIKLIIWHKIKYEDWEITFDDLKIENIIEFK